MSFNTPAVTGRGAKVGVTDHLMRPKSSLDVNKISTLYDKIASPINVKKHSEGPSLSVEQSAAPPWGVASAASVLVPPYAGTRSWSCYQPHSYLYVHQILNIFTKTHR